MAGNQVRKIAAGFLFPMHMPYTLEERPNRKIYVSYKANKSRITIISIAIILDLFLFLQRKSEFFLPWIFEESINVEQDWGVNLGRQRHERNQTTDVKEKVRSSFLVKALRTCPSEEA